ncbi:MAG: Lrp/AsnC family transcriptional regulator [Candidatus Lokiarchaeota archaeon]|nr:Lrp/AsnC family transcriptional regulator [Candidatus Lokiarchaeota archaeon]
MEQLEIEALEYIKTQGSKGVLQSELWKYLGATSRDGSRIAVSLEESGYIEREKELNNGRWTYRLYYVNKNQDEVKWDTLDDCPCFLCDYLDICGTERSTKCKKLLHWMQESTA